MTTSDLSIAWATDTEAILADVLSGTVGMETVDPDSHFFDDLGADSMLMARFCARLRKREGAPSVSMKDIYAYPTIRSLAAAMASVAPIETERPAPAPLPAAPPVSTIRFVVCGALQLLCFLVSTALAALAGAAGQAWISSGAGWLPVYGRTVVFGAVTFLAMATLPIVAKWVLVGRWTAQQIPVWSLAYVRFWLVKVLVRMNPLVLFAGSPLYACYLRALGADIGRDVAILSRNVPVCTDLLTVGDRTVIRKDSYFNCYRAHAGFIQTGPVTLGHDVIVSEATVLDVGTALGDGAQLGHASALHAGQSVPAGEHWHGSPAVRCDVDYRTVEPGVCSSRRKAAYSSGQVLSLLLLKAPLVAGCLRLLFELFPDLDGKDAASAWRNAGLYREAATISLLIFAVGLAVGLLAILTVPRLLSLAFEPGRVYPLYGFHYGLHRAITRMTNSRFFLMLFGDSSFIVHYLGRLGYDLTPVVQTGSNFGVSVKHETPFLTSIGSGTMVADGLSVMNADYSNAAFRLVPVAIGAQNFLGNTIAYPAGGRTGQNCLLATKAMVPIDGEIRENVGLLGSPCFEIPRSVLRDGRFDHLASGEELTRRLAAKNRYNLRTIGLYLFVRWVPLYFVALMALIAGSSYDSSGATALAAASLGIFAFNVAYALFVERAATKFRPLRPQFCSIYEPYFWYHERYWKMLARPRIAKVFNGTPFKGLWWRLAGVRIGRRVFDDGCGMVEPSLVTIGDRCTLNIGSEILCHSQEDGAFKSDHSVLGAGCTIGVGAYVHYGVTLGDGVSLEADSFLMKGEEVPPNARWGGNPARQVAR